MRRSSLLLLLLTICASQSVAADPNALLRLVPEESAVCFVVRDLRSTAQRLESSPLVDWLRTSNLIASINDSGEVKKLNAVVTVLSAQFQVTPQQLRDDILGDLIVFAYTPGDPAKPESETGLLLLQARDPVLLARLMKQLDTFQKSSGEIRAVTVKKHRGLTYYVREKVKDQPEFYLLDKGLFALVNREAAIRKLIDRRVAADQAEDDEESPLQSGLRRLGLQDAFVTCWLHPRVFDAEFQARVEQTTDAKERAVMKQFFALWQGIDHLAITLQPGPKLELAIVAAVEGTKLPKEFHSLLPPSAGSSRLWLTVPTDAILAISGRVNIPALLVAVESFLPPENRAEVRESLAKHFAPILGQANLNTVLDTLGPDWLAWIRPSPDESRWMPEGLFAIRLGSTEDQFHTLSKILLPALDFAAQLIRYDYNRKHSDEASLKELTQGDVTVKSLANANWLSVGFQPSYAVRGGHLLLGSNPGTIRTFHAPAASAPDEKQAFKALLLRLSAKHLREYLLQHGGTLAKMQAKSDGRTSEEIRKEFTQFTRILEPIDRVEVHYTGDKSRLKLSATIEFIHPLAK